MRSRAVGAFFLAAGCLLGAGAKAQPVAVGSAPASVARADSLPARADSTGSAIEAGTDSLLPARVGRRSHVPRDTVVVGPQRPAWQANKSPRTALFASFLVPGLGQLYDERPFWAAVAAGVEFYFIGSWVVEQRLTNRYLAIYNADPSNTDAQVLSELHRDDRIQAQWLLGLTILISGLQAYVDAALADFDTSPLPLHLAPDLAPGRAAMSVQWRF